VSISKRQKKQGDDVAATLSAPFSGMDIAAGKEDEADETDEQLEVTNSGKGPVRRVSLNKTRSGKPMDAPPPIKTAEGGDNFKKTRRGGKGRKRPISGTAQQPTDSTPEVARKNGTFKQKGWRQTPFLQAGPESPRTPGVIAGRVGLEAVHASNRKTRKQKAIDATNGWATEDATDIQELPEFDFIGNLSKFDKRSVFDQIRNEDTTADEERLVSHNRLPKPGTNYGKNLHPTENVLENNKARFPEHSLSSSASEDLDGFDSGRNSRRAMSRASTKRVPHRQGSGLNAEELPSHAAASAILSRSKGSFNTRASYASSSHVSGSPKPSFRQSPPLDSPSPFLSPLPQTSSGRPSCFRVMSTNRTAHVVTPGGMARIEETAEVEFGLSEDITAENSGRGIAEIALSVINPGGRRLARENMARNTRPVIVVLVGNHRSGARAVAAARHLNARGLLAMVAVLGFERDAADWDRDVRRQLELLQRFGGLVTDWSDMEAALKRLDAPPELIIDALLGRGREFEALGDADKKQVIHIVGWANKSRAGVLAVDSPSGVGGSTGKSCELSYIDRFKSI
jgi:enhancer of mRNA-decapping protein 3